MVCAAAAARGRARAPAALPAKGSQPAAARHRRRADPAAELADSANSRAGGFAAGNDRRRRWLWPASPLRQSPPASRSSRSSIRARPVDAAALRFEIARPEALASSSWVVISPDGRQLAYAASVAGELNRLWIRSLETQEARPLAGTPGFDGRPFWSADSRTLTFSVSNKLRKIDATGGPAQVLADIEGVVVGGYWPSPTGFAMAY